MRYNDKSVVTAQNVCGKLGYKTVHSVYRLANVLGIEHWKLTGKELARFKVDNGLVSAVRWLTVYPVDAFDGLHRGMLVKCPELKEEEPAKNTRNNLMCDTPINHIFDGHNVDIIGINDDPYFGLNSVAIVLGVSNPKTSIDTKDRDYVVKLTNRDISKVGITYFRKLHNTGELFLTEAGMYKFVLCSRKPNAEKFQKWVTSEVLPSIRKTGGYGVEGNLATVLENQRVLMRSMETLWLYLSTRDACAMSFSKEIAKHQMR